jgi:hypothetical protein
MVTRKTFTILVLWHKRLWLGNTVRWSASVVVFIQPSGARIFLLPNSWIRGIVESWNHGIVESWNSGKLLPSISSWRHHIRKNAHMELFEYYALTILCITPSGRSKFHCVLHRQSSPLSGLSPRIGTFHRRRKPRLYVRLSQWNLLSLTRT